MVWFDGINSPWPAFRNSHVNRRVRDIRMSIPFLACMAAAAAFYHLPPRVLPSIQAVEGGRPGLIQPNTNGTADLGLMQVNTIWVKPLARYARMTESAVLDHLIDDPCFNIRAAAAIMQIYMAEARDGNPVLDTQSAERNMMVAIGYYHSHTPARGSAYQQKVLAAAGTLFQKRQDRGR
jgi:hypothetical protein